MLERGPIRSLLLWGPPGSGKTTLARVISTYHPGPTESFSAVLDGVRELRAVVSRARRAIALGEPPTLMLVDEIHRFNRAQQDAFLPHVEDGTLVIVGMTTENPGFEIVAPLLSRLQVITLEPLTDADVRAVLEAALADAERGVTVAFTPEALDALVTHARGDARVALGILEAAAALAPEAHSTVDLAGLTLAMQTRPLRHDKSGDAHYDLLSAFIKAMRGSDPDAAVYYLARLLAGGEDPLLVARRMIVFAAEDVGLAAPESLAQAVAAAEAVGIVGLPEARIPLATTAIHLACAPKSNAAYSALGAATAAIERTGPLDVPLELRNAPTAFARSQGHGRGYESPHLNPEAPHTASYLPSALRAETFYSPSERGWEGARRAEILAIRARRRS